MTNYLKKYWLKYRWPFILAVFCVACEACCDLLQPKIMSTLIDNGAALGNMQVVIHEGTWMISIVLVGAIFAMTRNVIASTVSQNFGAELRQELFIKIQSMRMDEIDSFQGGSLVTRQTSDVTQMTNFVNGMMRMFFKAPVLCIGAIIMSSTLEIKTLPIILTIILLVGLIITFSMRMAYPRFGKVQEALDNLNTRMREYLAGIRLVKAFRRFEQEDAKFSKANTDLTETTISANKVLAIFSPLMSLIVNLGIALLLFLGAKWVGAGTLQVGAVMAFITYLTQILTSLNMISNILNMLVRVKASNERISAVLVVPTHSHHCEQSSALRNEHFDKNAIAVAPTSGDLRGNPATLVFHNVGFSYKSSTGLPALSDINFSLNSGQTLGVIGPTGSGKSTLGSLILRFYEPTEGSISIGETQIGDIPEKSWRERVTIVPQTAMLFAGTIAENIRWGKSDATNEEIMAASTAAQATEFILATLEKYETFIGQSGVNLSGGQKQRLSIARALVRHPDILVLDDCTSALDLVTESKVKRALREYPMTSILVTQRIATAMSCDLILVLENGRQVGFGTHDELIETCATYRDIYSSQIGEKAL